MAAGDWKEMFAAASGGDLPLVKYHIQSGVDPNYQHPEILTTPLVAAIANGHYEVVDFLLTHGADPSIVSIFDNMDAYQAAEFHRRPRIGELLQAKFPRKSQGSVAKWLQRISNWLS